jgi:hypothetical protein
MAIVSSSGAKWMRHTVGAALALALTPTMGFAATLSFDCITNNIAGDCAIGESQLSVDVTSYSATQVLFEFNNTGLSASSITDAYFDNGSLLGLAFLIDADEGSGDPGVDFTQGASPGDLPGGNNASPAFVATAGFTADSDPPTQPNGVNPGETLGIVFDLQGGGTFADVLSELASGELRIGIHVQGFGTGGSESFVNNPIPIPAAVWLFGSGLLGLAAVARRKL